MVRGGRKKIREVKMAAWSELWSVFLLSPVSPQPPLSVLPQPVVFQSIGSQPSSHRACALPGCWRKQLTHPSLPLSCLLHPLFPHCPHFLSLSLPPPSLLTQNAQYSWEEEEQEEEVALWKWCRCLKPTYYVTSCSNIVCLIILPHIWGENKDFCCLLSSNE